MSDEPSAAPPPPPPGATPPAGPVPPPPPHGTPTAPSRVPRPPATSVAPGPVNGTRGILFGALAAIVSAAAIYGIAAATNRSFVYAFIIAGLAIGAATKYGAGARVPITTALVIGAVTIVAMLIAATLLAGREDDTLSEFIERNPLTLVMMIGAGVVAFFVASRE